MKVELIPVIEIIGEYFEDTPIPDNGPYWIYPDVWENHNQELLAKTGYPEKLSSYKSGSSFYKISEISDKNLKHHIFRQLDDFLKGESEAEDISSFEGGYVLKIDGQDKFFPQCCSDLGDFKSWENLVNEKPDYWFGHPAPEVKIENGIITFTCDNTTDEKFSPRTDGAIEIFSFPVNDLKNAFNKAKSELELFAKRINKISEEENFQIQNLGQKFIWDYSDYIMLN